MKSTDHSAKRAMQAGFTLVEVMLVVVILGILATVAVVATRGRTKDAAISATRASIAAYSTAVDSFEVDNGVYPNSLDELITDTGHPTWHGPYMKGGRLTGDSWGRPLQYSKTDKDYKIISAGPDGSFGGPDDITN